MMDDKVLSSEKMVLGLYNMLVTFELVFHMMEETTLTLEELVLKVDDVVLPLEESIL